MEAVMITYVETPISLWVQIVSDENTQKIFGITEQLAQQCPTAQHVSGQPDLGKVKTELLNFSSYDDAKS